MRTFSDINELLDYFQNLSQWEVRYKTLIQLSQNLSFLAEAEKIDALLLPGCESNLWLGIRLLPCGKIELLADSDSKILKGILYVIELYCAQFSKENIDKMNLRELFEQIGVLNHLSSNRKNGIFAIEERIKNLSAL